MSEEGPDRAPGDRVPGRRLNAGRVARDRVRLRRRRSGALTVLLVAAALAVAGIAGRDAGLLPSYPVGAGGVAAGPPATGSAGPALPASPPSSTGPGGPAASYPQTGPDRFAVAGGQGPLLGTAGTLHRFRVAVEDGMGQDVGAFAGRVEEILGDGRGWTATGALRFQRVPASTSAEFTVYLATPGTTEKMCAAGGLHTEGYASCRLPERVVVNVGRWLTAVPEYGAPLDEYQAYELNHEVGRQLGEPNQGCPGPGRPAPVMQQQAYGLRGCVAYGWPYRDGVRYAGPAIP